MREHIVGKKAGQGAERLGADLLIGAEAIARELDWKTKDGLWNRRRVYHVAELGTVPIHRIKGLGLCARRSALHSYFDFLDEQFKNMLDTKGPES